MKFVKPLWKHQEQDFDRFKDMPNGALFWEMGTGKSPTAANIMRYKFGANGRVLKTIIFAPPIVLHNWKNEITAHTKSGEWVEVLDGTGKKRIEKLKQSNKRIFIANYEAATMKDLWNTIEDYGFEMIICDESHKIKSPQTTRTKKILALSKQPQVKYKFILTGSPFLNSLLDIYTQITFLDSSIFGSNFFAFRAKYFYDKNAGMPSHKHFPDWRPIKGIESIFNQKLADISSRRTKEETLTLPPKIYQTINVDLSPEQMRVYNQLKTDFIAYLEDDACIAQLAITKALRLQQIVSGIFTNDNGEIKEIENERYQALEEILEGLPPNSKFVVWAVYRYNYKKIAELFDKLEIKYSFLTGEQSAKEKQTSIDALNSGEVRAIIGNPGSGGIGCNLTAATYNIYFNRSFSLEHRIQSEDRSHRGGQTQKVTIIDIVAHKTIDEQIVQKLKDKKKIGESVLDLKELVL